MVGFLNRTGLQMTRSGVLFATVHNLLRFQSRWSTTLRRAKTQPSAHSTFGLAIGMLQLRSTGTVKVQAILQRKWAVVSSGRTGRRPEDLISARATTLGMSTLSVGNSTGSTMPRVSFSFMADQGRRHGLLDRRRDRYQRAEHSRGICNSSILRPDKVRQFSQGSMTVARPGTSNTILSTREVLRPSVVPGPD